jgi:hypothetical protein
MRFIEGSLEPLGGDFDRDRGHVRALLVLSPT